jgi:hypothetical protein
MAGRPLATAFVRIRPDVSTFRTETQAQMAGVGTAAGKEGEKAGKTFGSKMAQGLKGFSGVISKAGALGFAAAAFGILKAGDQLEQSQVRLNTAIKGTGGSARAVAPQLDAVRGKMEKWGFTNAEVNDSLGTIITATGNVKDAMKAEGLAADLARFKHISLSEASNVLAKSFAGNSRALRGLNLTLATGSTFAKALGKAQTDLTDQIQASGGIAKFAAEHHMSLATAERLVSQASGAATAAQNKLAASGLSVATATKLIAEAQGGSAKAVKELAKHNLTLGAAQRAVKDAASGSIPALNRLGLVVLPQSATAAQRFEQITRSLNARLGGQAAAAAKTAGGQFGVLKAQFIDIAARIGAKVLPMLLGIVLWLQRSHVLMPLVIALFVTMGAVMAASAIAAMSLATALTGGIALAVVGLIIGITLLVKHWHQVEQAFLGFYHWLAAHPYFAFLIPAFGQIIALALVVIKHWRGLQTAFRVVMEALSGFAKALAHNFAVWFGRIIDEAGRLRHDVAHWFDLMRRDVGHIWDVTWNNTFGRAARGVADVSRLAAGFWNRLRHGFDVMRHDIAHIWDVIWDNTVGRIVRGVKDVGKALGALKQAFLGPISWVLNHTIAPLDKVWNIANKIFGSHLPNLPTSFRFARGGQAKREEGGYIRGPGGPKGDRIPALLSDREYVHPAEAVDYYGLDFMEAIRTRKFAGGGLVRHKPKNPNAFINPGGGWGAIGHFLSGIGGSILNFGKSAFATLSKILPGNIIAWLATNGAKLAGNALKAILNGVMVGGGVRGMVRGGGDKLIDAAVNAIAGLFSSHTSTGGGAANTMLQFMLSKVGLGYSQQARFGPQTYDCSGLVYMAAKAAGLPIPSGVNLANTEADWFARRPGAGLIHNAGKSARGDLVFFHGAAPFMSSFGPIGHVGMALNSNTMVSALGHAFGVTKSPFSSRFVVGVRLPGAGPGSASPASPGLMTVARYLMAHGFTKAAAAGIAGTVAGESGGNPESVGSGGAGLIGWTPPTSAYPIRNIVTGNPRVDMGNQLLDMLAYIQRNGSIADLNAAGGPMNVAWRFSSKYERPAVTGSDIRPAEVMSIYARLAKGGLVRMAGGGVISEPVIGVGLRSGRGYALGEHGKETVTPGEHGSATEALLAAIAEILAAGFGLQEGHARAAAASARRAGYRAFYGVR